MTAVAAAVATCTCRDSCCDEVAKLVAIDINHHHVSPNFYSLFDIFSSFFSLASARAGPVWDLEADLIMSSYRQLSAYLFSQLPPS